MKTYTITDIIPNAGRLKQPICAWSQHVSTRFMGAFLIRYTHEHPYLPLSEIHRQLSRQVKDVPNRARLGKIALNLLRRGWIEGENPDRPTKLRGTAEGMNYYRQAVPILLNILRRSFATIEHWEKDLFLSSETPSLAAGGPEDLFDHGGMWALHRTLMLYVLDRYKVTDAETGEKRPMFFYELMRFLEERYQWRANEATLIHVKDEQVESGYLRKKIATIKVPAYLPHARNNDGRLIDSIVELLIVTTEGQERLQAALLEAWGILQRTRAVLDSWEAYLKEGS